MHYFSLCEYTVSIQITGLLKPIDEYDANICKVHYCTSIQNRANQLPFKTGLSVLSTYNFLSNLRSLRYIILTIPTLFTSYHLGSILTLTTQTCPRACQPTPSIIILQLTHGEGIGTHERHVAFRNRHFCEFVGRWTAE